jgi:hypothetical protein
MIGAEAGSVNRAPRDPCGAIGTKSARKALALLAGSRVRFSLTC